MGPVFLLVIAPLVCPEVQYGKLLVKQEKYYQTTIQPPSVTVETTDIPVHKPQ